MQTALDILESITPELFDGKEGSKVDVFLGSFTVSRDAMQYVHEISLPSL